MTKALVTRRPQTLVVSGVNLVEGGTLTVLRECLRAALNVLSADWQIVALVHNAELVGVPGIAYREFPRVKTSWLRRLWFEYWQCRSLSRRLNADVWFALHDMTPTVVAPRQAVYCHNPMPFYRMTVREIWLAPKLLLFNSLYGLIYRVNIGRNHAVVVQQEWLRREFERRFGARNVIVARPVPNDRASSVCSRLSGTVFLYPALPRVFKNFELIGDAVRWLEQRSDWRGEVRITIDGHENAYAAQIRSRYGGLKSLKFVGLQSRESMARQYRDADCLLFPSRLETWGLPLTEAKSHGLAILAADLPYAHEAVGTYDAAAFFDVSDPIALGNQLLAFQKAELKFSAQIADPVREPYAADWPALIRTLVAEV